MDKNVIKIGIADGVVSSAPHILITLGLGSCIGVCLYDKETKIGGLIHIMLPSSSIVKKGKKLNEMKFADTGIPKIIYDLKKAGANTQKLTAKVIGGANMFPNTDIPYKNTIGYKNYIATVIELQKSNIPILKEEIGGNIGRSIRFDLNNGSVEIRTGTNRFTI